MPWHRDLLDIDFARTVKAVGSSVDCYDGFHEAITEFSTQLRISNDVFGASYVLKKFQSLGRYDFSR